MKVNKLGIAYEYFGIKLRLYNTQLLFGDLKMYGNLELLMATSTQAVPKFLTIRVE